MTDAPALASPVQAIGASALGLDGGTAAAAAKAEIQSLIVDKDFGRLLLTRVDPGAVADPQVAAAKARWTDLHRRAYGQPTEIRSGADVAATDSRRITQSWDEYIAHVRQKMDLSPEQEAEIRRGTVSKDVRARAVAEKDRRIREEGFLKRLRSGDPDTTRRWNTLLQILSLRPV